MDKQTFPKKHPVWTSMLTVLGLLIALSAIGSCSADTEKPISKTATDTGKAKTAPVNPPAETEPAPVREDPNPDGTFKSSCDFLSPDDVLSGDYKFFATAKLSNTGNVGIKVKVTAVFDQVSSNDIKLTRTVRLKVHAHRTVKMRTPASQSQVTEFQSSPDYFASKACRVHTTIVDSFGRPPFEES
jgi:hypothetical protein